MIENSVKRKLRAILSADVEAYGRMMGEDEVGNDRTMTAYLKSTRSIISEHSGRVFSSPGDAGYNLIMDLVETVPLGPILLVLFSIMFPDSRFQGRGSQTGSLLHTDSMSLLYESSTFVSLRLIYRK